MFLPSCCCSQQVWPHRQLCESIFLWRCEERRIGQPKSSADAWSSHSSLLEQSRCGFRRWRQPDIFLFECFLGDRLRRSRAFDSWSWCRIGGPESRRCLSVTLSLCFSISLINTLPEHPPSKPADTSIAPFHFQYSVSYSSRLLREPLRLWKSRRQQPLLKSHV